MEHRCEARAWSEQQGMCVVGGVCGRGCKHALKGCAAGGACTVRTHMSGSTRSSDSMRNGRAYGHWHWQGAGERALCMLHIMKDLRWEVNYNTFYIPMFMRDVMTRLFQT